VENLHEKFFSREKKALTPPEISMLHRNWCKRIAAIAVIAVIGELFNRGFARMNADKPRLRGF